MPNGIGAGSTEYFVCRPIQELLHPKYLLAFFKTTKFLKDGEKVMQGAVGQQRVPKQYVLEHEIPLAPLNEQKRIAEKLDRLLERVDACRAHLDRIPLLLKRFRQSVLAAATSGRLTADWREEFAKSCSYEKLARKQIAEILADRQKKTNKMSQNHLLDEEFDIPEGWLWVSLDSLSSQIVDGTHFTPNYITEGVPFVSVKDIRNGKIDFSGTKFIDKKEHLEL
jgi:type I restriction enzyme S subunit